MLSLVGIQSIANSRYFYNQSNLGSIPRHPGPHIVCPSSGSQAVSLRLPGTLQPPQRLHPRGFPRSLSDTRTSPHISLSDFMASPLRSSFCALSSSVRIHPCPHATELRIAPLTIGYSSSEATNLLAAWWTASWLGAGRPFRKRKGSAM